MSDNSALIASVLFKTDPTLALAIDYKNSWQADVRTRGARVAKYRRYERGEHDANMTNQMRNMLRLKTDDSKLSALSINYCPIVIDKMAGRLRVSEITTGDETQDGYISSLLISNDFEALQGMMFRGAIRDGDSFVMVDPVTMRWTSEPAYDGFSGLTVIYGADDFPIWACRMWSQADMDVAGEQPTTTVSMMVVVYQPDRITYWKGRVNSQEAEPVIQKDTGTNERPWILGKVPIIHYANLLDNYTSNGESELRKIIAPQDVLNRTLHSMIMASEFAAFDVSWSIGMEIDKTGITPGAVINLILLDAAGNVILEPTVEQIAFLNACKVGQFSSTDIIQYTGQVEVIVKQISQVSQTPIYGVTAEGNLSGEALKQLEIGLIGKIKRFQNENTSAVRLLIELTADIQSIFDTGEGQPPKLKGISVNWQSPEILDVGMAITSILDIRERAPGLFDDDFLRQRIGALLSLTQAQIRDEGIKAQNSQSLSLDFLTGARGTIPVA